MLLTVINRPFVSTLINEQNALMQLVFVEVVEVEVVHDNLDSIIARSVSVLSLDDSLKNSWIL